MEILKPTISTIEATSISANHLFSSVTEDVENPRKRQRETSMPEFLRGGQKFKGNGEALNDPHSLDLLESELNDGTSDAIDRDNIILIDTNVEPDSGVDLMLNNNDATEETAADDDIVWDEE